MELGGSIPSGSGGKSGTESGGTPGDGGGSAKTGGVPGSGGAEDKACAPGTFSTIAAHTCVAWSDCLPGQFVKAEGSLQSDRVCSTCEPNTFSTSQNESACKAWTKCAPTTVIVGPGSATSDVTCNGTSIQFGSDQSDQLYALGLDGFGNIYVAGDTLGALPGQVNAGGADAFLRKYDASGTELWTRQFGGEMADVIEALAVAANGTVYVAGTTSSAFPGQAGGSDIFVRKYDAEGALIWSRLFGTDGYDSAESITLDDLGNVVVAGGLEGTLSGQSNAGSLDAFVRKYDAAGNELWTRLFGAINLDTATDVGTDSSGNVYVAGYGYEPLPDVSAAGIDSFLRKYSSNGTELWTRQIGTSEDVTTGGLAVDGTDHVYVVGTVSGALPGQASAGGFDAFVRKYDASGAEEWTRQFGESSLDSANAVSVDADGSSYLVGRMLGSGADSFVRKYDANGSELWSHRFGMDGDYGAAIALDSSGQLFIGGETGSALPGQTHLGFDDGMVVILDQGLF